MAAIREEFPDIDIIVENHCQTDLNSAIRIGELCDKYNMMAYEEPVTMLNPQMMKELHDRIRTPLAAGERIYSRWGYYNFFKDNSIQLIQPDACNCGGITELKKIADMAHVFDARVQVHVAGAVITNAASLQLEAAIPNFGIQQIAVQFRRFDNGTDVFDRFFKIRADVQPVDIHLAGVGGKQAKDDFDRCRFSGAVRAEEADDLALFDVKADVGKHRPILEAFAYSVDGQQHAA